MTIKTPEEVAADTIGGYVSDFAARRGSRPTLIDRDAAEALIIQAIEAERAQWVASRVVDTIDTAFEDGYRAGYSDGLGDTVA